jgi:hypothetical protein
MDLGEALRGAHDDVCIRFPSPIFPQPHLSVATVMGIEKAATVPEELARFVGVQAHSIKF